MTAVYRQRERAEGPVLSTLTALSVNSAEGLVIDLDDPDQVLAEAERAGVDLAGLKRNLELSPDERLDQFLRAWAWLEWARDARRKEIA